MPRHLRHLRHLVLAVLAFASLLLSACGFQLRGAYALPFDTLYMNLPETGELYALIKRTVEAGTNARVVGDAKQAQATLQVLSDLPAKNILSLNPAGRVREYQLVRSVSFRVIDAAGREFMPASQIVIRRDISFADEQVLAKEAEEALLWKDIQNDLVQQLMRRLAAAKKAAATE